MLFSYVVETMIVVGANMVANDNYKLFFLMIDSGERGVGRLKRK
jgi:hypothetical protein